MCRVSSLKILSVTLLACSWAAAPARSDDAYRSKTIELRSGTVTLAPSDVSSPDALRPVSQPSAKPSPGPTSIHSLESSPWRSDLPLLHSVPTVPSATTEDIAARAQAALRVASTPITSERVLVSFERRISEADRAALSKNGIHVDEYLGGANYSARVTLKTLGELSRASQPINRVLHIAVLDEDNAYLKVDPALAGRMAIQGDTPAGAAPPADGAPSTSGSAGTSVTVQLWPEANIEQVRGELAAFGEIKRVSPRTRKIDMMLPRREMIDALAKLKGVQYVAPTYDMRAQNTHVRSSLGVSVAANAPHSLSGREVRIGIWDGGHVAADHPSFAGRLSVYLERERVNRRDNEHATHVAGTIAGTGEYIAVTTSSGTRAKEGDTPAFGDKLLNRRRAQAATAEAAPAVAAEAAALEDRYPGVAPASQLISFDYFDAAEELTALLIDQPDAIDVANNSWTLDLNPRRFAGVCKQMATYSMNAADFDAAISGGTPGQEMRRIPIVFAAGNVRDDGVCGMSAAAGFPNFRTVLPPSTAKNVITVGAIDADTSAMTDFSSWGPTSSGRLKPDIVAPGCRQFADGERGILSTVPTTTIGRRCGTSMAAPAVTGVVALLIEKMVKLGVSKVDVYPSTYKALLIHGAKDLGRPGPDFEFGYGQITLGPTLKLMDDRAFEQLRLDIEGQTHTKDIVIPPGAQQLKVTVAWDDRPTGVFSDEALANDIDLRLLSPLGEQHLPFVLSTVPGKETEPARPGVDHTNVVEQVLVERPVAGIWRIEVRAHKIGSPAGGQTYSLVSSLD